MFNPKPSEIKYGLLRAISSVLQKGNSRLLLAGRMAATGSMGIHQSNSNQWRSRISASLQSSHPVVAAAIPPAPGSVGCRDVCVEYRAVARSRESRARARSR